MPVLDPRSLIPRQRNTANEVVITYSPLPTELRLMIVDFLCPAGGDTLEERKNLQNLALVSREWLGMCQLLLFKKLKIQGDRVRQLVDLFVGSPHLAFHVGKCTLVGQGQTQDRSPSAVPKQIEVLDLVALVKLLQKLQSIALVDCWLTISQYHAEHWIMGQEALSVGNDPVPRMFLYRVLVDDFAFRAMMSLSKTLTLAEVSVCPSLIDLQAFNPHEYALAPAHFANLDHFELHPMAEGTRPDSADEERRVVIHRGLQMTSLLFNGFHDHLTSFTTSFNLFECPLVSRVFAFLRLKGGRITNLNLDLTPTTQNSWGFSST